MSVALNRVQKKDGCRVSVDPLRSFHSDGGPSKLHILIKHVVFGKLMTSYKLPGHFASSITDTRVGELSCVLGRNNIYVFCSLCMMLGVNMTVRTTCRLVCLRQ